MRELGSLAKWFSRAAIVGCLSPLVLLSTSAGFSAEPSGSAPTDIRTVSARREANSIQLNGAPVVLMWALGCDDPAELDQYASSGLNTLYVVVQDSSQEELARASELISAAEARGLAVVCALAPSALQDPDGIELYADPWSEAYAAAAEAFARAVVTALKLHPRIIAWSVEAVPPNQVVWGDGGFRAYLQEWYPSLSGLNASWGIQFTDWQDITAAGVRDIDTTKPGGLGRATVDFAYYRETSYADLLSLWARAVRAADSSRLLFASALPDYRSIISAPTDFDGLVLNTYPSLAEADWQTHNVHAVDIARRANQFAVVQTLEVSSGANESSLVGWADLALLHGAAGIAFSDWSAVRDSQELSSAVQQIGETIRTSRAFPAQPSPRAAILYEPITGGAIRGDSGLYGYLDGFTPNEPSVLFALGRNGSRFGQFDVLSLDSLRAIPLTQYRVILTPAALYLPNDAQLALHNFVMSGGVLLADAGVGMYQAEGLVDSMPSVMREVFGIHFEFDMSESQQEPSLDVGDAGSYGAPMPDVPGTQDNPDLRRFAAALEELLRRPDVADFLGTEFVGQTGSGLRAHSLGQGFAVYVPAFLYETSSPSDELFGQLHARVLSRGSDLEVIEPTGLWPQVAAALYHDWSLGLASPDGVRASVVLYGAGSQVYQVPAGAMRLGNPAEEDRVELLFPGAALAVAHPLPIYVGTADTGAVCTVSVIEYRPDRIELLVHGTGAQVSVRQGAVQIHGGMSTAVEIAISDGLYRLASGSSHRVILQKGPSGRRAWEQEMMPNPETGAIVIQDTFVSARLVVEPAPG